MNLNDELRLAIKRAGTKKIADEFGLSVSMINKWWEEGENHRTNPLEPFLKLMETLNWDKELMQHICGRAGASFVKDPPLKNGEAKDLMAVESVVMEDFGLLMHSIGHAVQDGKIERNETLKIRKHWNEVRSVTESFVEGCENGNFDAYHAHEAKLRDKQIGKGMNGHAVSANSSATLRV